MKRLFLATMMLLFLSSVTAQNKQKDLSEINHSRDIKFAEVACGECQFKMQGKGCHLAIRLDGKCYWVDGADVDSFGDAHDKKSGLCNNIRKADVQGELKNKRFQLSYIKLADEKPHEK